MQFVGDLLAHLGIPQQQLVGSGVSPNAPLDELTSREIQELSRMVAPKVEGHWETALGAILPGLQRWGSHDLTRSAFKVRSYNTLARMGVHTWSDLAELTPSQIFSTRSAGSLTVTDIVEASIAQSVSSPYSSASKSGGEVGDVAEAIPSRVSDGIGALNSESPDPARGNESRIAGAPTTLPSTATWNITGASLLEMIRIVAAWGIRERGAQHLEDLLEPSAELDSLPSDLATLWAGFGRVALAKVADPALLDITLDDLAERLFGGMDDRQRSVYRRRVLDGATLAAVGEELEVSRERVRQLQVKADKRIASMLERHEFRLLHWRAADLRSTFGTLAPTSMDRTRVAIERSLRGASTDAAELLRPIILRLAGPYRERSGWMSLEAVDMPDPADIVSMADEFGLLPVAEAHDWLATCGVLPEFRDAWLEDFGRFRRDGDQLMVWSGNVVDKSVALLSALGEPMSADDLVALIDEGHDLRALRGRFFADERLIRANRTDWALRAWGLEEYTGITDELTQRIEEGGGEVEVSAIVQEIVRQFGVKESSVRAYTTAPMFVVDGNRIRLRSSDEPIHLDEALESCTGAFRSSERSVSLMISVDNHAIRGSGQPLSRPVAAALGVAPGRPRVFQHGDATLGITWPMTSAVGPSLGSVRAAVVSAGAGIGDRVRLDFDLEQASVSAELVPQDLDAYEDAERMRLLTGISADLDGALAALASAIDTDPASVRRILIERGESELAELLPVPAVDPRLASTLSDLAQAISRR